MKFQVGEIAIALAAGIHPMQECEILALPSGDWRRLHFERAVKVPPGMYVIRVAESTSKCGDGLFHTPEKYLRKRRPPIPEEVLRQFDVIPVEGEPA